MTRFLLALAMLSLTAAGCASNEAGDIAPASATTSTSSTTEPATTTEEIPAPVETTVYREPTQPAYTAPVEPAVVLGEQCFSSGATATTNDGSTAYCSRQAGWGKHIWSLSSGVAANPELQEQSLEKYGAVSPGDICYDDSATTTDAQGRTLYCNPQVDGEYPGSVLMWYLEP